MTLCDEQESDHLFSAPQGGTKRAGITVTSDREGMAAKRHSMQRQGEKLLVEHGGTPRVFSCLGKDQTGDQNLGPSLPRKSMLPYQNGRHTNLFIFKG